MSLLLLLKGGSASEDAFQTKAIKKDAYKTQSLAAQKTGMVAVLTFSKTDGPEITSE